VKGRRRNRRARRKARRLRRLAKSQGKSHRKRWKKGSRFEEVESDLGLETDVQKSFKEQDTVMDQDLDQDQA